MIKTLILMNTRCFHQKKLIFEHPQTYMFGDNGVGKTTILEAIHMIATTKSHRTNQDKEIIQEGKPFSKITLETNQNTFEMVITDKGKRVWFNGVEKRKLSQFIGHLNIVLFAPEDIELIKGSPTYRRQFLDIAMTQIDPSYLDILTKHKKILKQRNALLKKIDVTGDFTFLDILSEQLLIEAKTMIEKRAQLINILNDVIQPITKQFQLPLVKIEYNDDVNLEQLKLHLLTKQKVDIIQQATSRGPHKDDFTVYYEQKNASQYASQGQQRLLALSLKIALFQHLKKESNKELILLLDDVLSELDETHQQQLLTYEFQNYPLIMNSTHDHVKHNMHIMHLKKES
ncbi:MAG: DNA replication and repair protein RecF [Firmicutes bacterium]|nr:DNA replication and repair protein RecF [Bacillota bacterium]